MSRRRTSVVGDILDFQITIEVVSVVSSDATDLGLIVRRPGIAVVVVVVRALHHTAEQRLVLWQNNCFFSCITVKRVPHEEGVI